MWVNRRCFSDEFFFFFPSIVALHCQINNVLSEQNTFLMPLNFGSKGYSTDHAFFLIRNSWRN